MVSASETDRFENQTRHWSIVAVPKRKRLKKYEPYCHVVWMESTELGFNCIHWANHWADNDINKVIQLELQQASPLFLFRITAWFLPHLSGSIANGTVEFVWTIWYCIMRNVYIYIKYIYVYIYIVLFNTYNFTVCAFLWKGKDLVVRDHCSKLPSLSIADLELGRLRTRSKSCKTAWCSCSALDNGNAKMAKRKEKMKSKEQKSDIFSHC